MSFIADLHIHSRYSRATSADMSPDALWRWAQLKGITVIGTGDFTHPLWLKELGDRLEPAGNGLLRLKDAPRSADVPESCRAEVFFLLSAEISCIYRKGGRTRKVHALVFSPDFRDVARINAALSKIGNLSSDGRPILGLDARELLRIVLNESENSFLVPAHAWTPHFSVFGAVSGFDSLEECFDELTPHIFAIETGLSSDPAMNRRLSSLDRISLISNSDAHSPAKIGREATVFDTGVSFDWIREALRSGDGIEGTIEFFPEEGKYHHDGHRACAISLSPAETRRAGNLCPACGRKVTVGVLHRVEKLADRPEGSPAVGGPPFRSIIPLQEVIAEVLRRGAATKGVVAEYFRLLEALGSEFSILLDVPLDALAAEGSPRLKEAIARVRSGDVHITPGFDGEFGRIRIFEEATRKKPAGRTPRPRQ